MVRVGPDFGDNDDHNLVTQISGQYKDEEDDRLNSGTQALTYSYVHFQGHLCSNRSYGTY